jgi:hypothetical protein
MSRLWLMALRSVLAGFFVSIGLSCCTRCMMSANGSGSGAASTT